MAGQFGMDVFDLAGVVFDRQEPPWWVLEVLGWLYAVKCLQEGQWGYKLKCRDYLENKPPKMIYQLFKDYADRIDHEEAKAR